MKLEKIRLQNFRNFEEQEFSFLDESGQVKPFTVLVGDNGVGKTAVLEGIVLGAAPIIKFLNPDAGDEVDLSQQLDIQFGKRWTSITVDSIIHNHRFQWKNSKRENIMVNDWPGSPEENQIKVKGFLCETFGREDSTREKVPLLLYYSITRVGFDVPMRGRSRGDVSPLNALDYCLDAKSDFRRFFEWFKTEEDEEFRNQRDLSPDYRSKALTAVRTAIVNMMGNYRDVKIKSRPSRMVLVDDQNRELQVEQLSGGYKVVFSMVADIAGRLAQANPQLDNPLNGEALILIDELDLHLHPKWQKRIVRDLRETFPNCQFIVSTHSASIVQSLNGDQLINLEDLERERTGAFKGWSLSEIQEYEMGVDYARTEEYEQIKKGFEVAVSEENGERAKALYRQLKEIVLPDSELLELFQFRLIGIGVDIHDLLE